jgi:uncharacterized peroxidase-related enzyme
MTWIKTIPYQQATGSLKTLYERVKGPDNNVDNIMLAHSLRPHTMEGHMALYKYVLHHPRNTVDKWFLEAIGVYTSMLNECHYCVEHHYLGMARLVGDEQRAQQIRQALEAKEPALAFDPKQTAALLYAQKLTVKIGAMAQSDIQAVQEAGWDDGEILEINQVTAYFNYANRTVLGLGINTQGDIIGLSPGDGDDLDNWNHA